MTEKTELAVKEEISLEVLRPVGPVAQIIQAWHDFQELKRGIITEDDYYLDERGKQQLKIGGWRKFGIAYGLSSKPLRDELLTDEKDPREYVWRVEVLLEHPRGRKVVGVGYFSSREIKHKHLEDGSIVHPTKSDKSGAPIPVPLEHTVYSRAYTRALKRATQDMIGPIEQEDEELEEPAVTTTTTTTPTPPPASTPRTTSPSKPHAQQAAVVWDFLDKILGDEIADHITLDALGEELVVKLDKKLVEEYGSAFTKAMGLWGYGVHETAEGITARLARPKG